MSKIRFDGGWFFDSFLCSLVYIHPRNVEEGELISNITPDENDIKIPRQLINPLIDELRKNGWIKPEYKPESREEDLKIIHRLLDVVEKTKRTQYET